MPSPVPTAQSGAFSAGLDVVRAAEPRIAEAIAGELAAQRDSLKLIASENYASPATLLAMGNWLSDKYAEGTIGHRFYAGCQQVDTVEAIAAEHARALFGAPHAYLQPHSGIDANLVAFWAILAHRVETPALHRAQARPPARLPAAPPGHRRQPGRFGGNPPPRGGDPGAPPRAGPPRQRPQRAR